ncbi:MAG: hypothetical protein JSR21_11060 [Proteobacteria bacterium]|nr:hypothetical protein [Pseudomonadota bacterium]
MAVIGASRRRGAFLAAALGMAAALFVAAAPPVWARQRGAAEPGRFDHYLLSLSVAPSFCAASPANRAKAECRDLTAAEYRRTPLTVHGLWPNRAGVSVNLQPQDCDGPPFAPPPAAQAAALERFMPGGIGLLRHEWKRHGTCSGLTQGEYVAALLRLAAQADGIVGGALRDGGMLGRPVPTADLLRAVAARDPAWAEALVVDCRHGRGGGPAMIAEIRVTLDRDFAPVPAQSAGLGQNSGCPRGGGFLPAGPLP